MFTMICRWLRALIGWEEFESWASVEQHNSSISQGKIQSLESQIDTMDKEIKALKYQRDLRDGNRVKLMDWEQLQAEFAANPKNYEEN